MKQIIKFAVAASFIVYTQLTLGQPSSTVVSSLQSPSISAATNINPIMNVQLPIIFVSQADFTLYLDFEIVGVSTENLCVHTLNNVTNAITRKLASLSLKRTSNDSIYMPTGSIVVPIRNGTKYSIGRCGVKPDDHGTLNLRAIIG